MNFQDDAAALIPYSNSMHPFVGVSSLSRELIEHIIGLENIYGEDWRHHINVAEVEYRLGEIMALTACCCHELELKFDKIQDVIIERIRNEDNSI